MTLGEKIAYYRTEKGYSQKGLAEAMGITNTRLNYWEKDKREPDVKMLNLLCQTLDLDPKVLLFVETEKAPAPSEDSAEAKYEKPDVESVLVSLGFIQDGQHISDRDLRFINGILDLIDAWFENSDEER